MKLKIYEDSCCGPTTIKEVLEGLKEHFKDEIELDQVSLLHDDEVAVPVEVVAALLNYGKKALPLIVLDNKVLTKGGSVSTSDVVDAITRHRNRVQSEGLKLNRLIRPIVLNELLLSPEKLDYGMVTPQCCSTTYFCACSST